MTADIVQALSGFARQGGYFERIELLVASARAAPGAPATLEVPASTVICSHPLQFDCSMTGTPVRVSLLGALPRTAQPSHTLIAPASACLRQDIAQQNAPP